MTKHYDKKTINEMLLKRRILPNKKGYKYLFFVIEYILGQKAVISLTYDVASKRFGVKPSTVEKSISNAIEGSFDSMFVVENYGEYASPCSGKITNKKFISMVIDEIHKCG